MIRNGRRKVNEANAASALVWRPSRQAWYPAIGPNTDECARYAQPTGVRPLNEFKIQYEGIWDLPSILSVILLIPFLGWGIYTLHVRFNRKEELNPVVEGVTLVGVILFLALEMALLRASLGHLAGVQVAAALGLFLAAGALYGHIVLSLLSYAFVGIFMPSGRNTPQTPKYGAAEALEQQGDYEGAVAEYEAVARAFPKDPKAALRIGDNLARLGRPEEAAPWFEQAFEHINSPEKCVSVAFRLFEIYARQLDRPDLARRLLERYLERFPESKHADAVQRKLEGLKTQPLPKANV